MKNYCLRFNVGIGYLLHHLPLVLNLGIHWFSVLLLIIIFMSLVTSFQSTNEFV